MENSEFAPDAGAEQSFDLLEPFERSGKAHFRGKKINVTHTINCPTFQQLRERDAKLPYRSVTINDEKEQILSDMTGKVNVALYDMVVLKTSGYKLNVSEGQSAEDRKAALATIPLRHKKDIMTAVLTVESEVIYEHEKEDDTFSWGDEQEYRVRTEIGDTGNFVIYTTVKEFTQEQIDEYDGATSFYLEKGGKKPVTNITTTSLPVAVKLFDAQATEASGLTMGKDTFDLKKPEHLSKLSAHIKRSIVDSIMKETRLDLGESLPL
jgi:hypothetical protein